MITTWEQFFEEIHQRPYWKALAHKVNAAYATSTCYPPKNLIFNAFHQCPLDKTTVVIIGQDPYPNPGQAMGMSFSVAPGVALPPSLRNIYKEIEDEGFGMMNYADGDLTYLAEQGVLLLNAYLSVEQGKPGSHRWPEYELLMQDILRFLSESRPNLVFLFWGSFAKKYAAFATNPKHLKLFANHPSPLSANHGGWFGCGHFVATNIYLKEAGLSPVDWCNGLIKL